MKDFCKIIFLCNLLCCCSERIFGILENHALFIDDPEKLLKLALGKGELQVPSEAIIEGMRKKVFEKEILNKLVLKNYHGSQEPSIYSCHLMLPSKLFKSSKMQ